MPGPSRSVTGSCAEVPGAHAALDLAELEVAQELIPRRAVVTIFFVGRRVRRRAMNARWPVMTSLGVDRGIPSHGVEVDVAEGFRCYVRGQVGAPGLSAGFGRRVAGQDVAGAGVALAVWRIRRAGECHDPSPV